jgi:hypothetical protein
MAISVVLSLAGVFWGCCWSSGRLVVRSPPNRIAPQVRTPSLCGLPAQRAEDPAEAEPLVGAAHRAAASGHQHRVGVETFNGGAVR